MLLLKELFSKYDSDMSGSVSKSEFEAQTKRLEKDGKFVFNGNWDEIFRKIDLDGDGRIDYHEFCVATIDHKKLLTEQNLKYVFDTLDVDKNGTIEI